LFIRAVRKLLLRFNPVLWDDDPKAARIAPLVEALDADLDELMAGGDFTEKQRESLLKDAYKLEAEGIAEMIPVSQIRQAAWWCRTAPLGRRKLLLIENAGRMLDAARNSLLKLLEEPPDRVNILLSTVQGDALLPTIRSRLRPYRFIPRDAAVEQEIIRRVFRDPEPGAGTTAGGLRDYLNAFLPVSRDRLLPLAACFAASLARQCVPSLRGRALRRELPPPLVSLGKLCAALAEPARAETAQDCGAAIQAVMAGAEKFEAPGLFNLFLESLLGLASRSLRESATLPGPSATVLADIFRSLAAEAAAAVGSYNQNPAQALERFAVEFKQRAAALV
jgi:DNA polymerase-3 subunit gamma/tau